MALGPDVMREQVDRLREATSQPNITVQVLPFSAGAHPGMTGPFTMLRFPERSMNVVYVELRGGAVYLERPEDIDLHEAIFERLSGLALNEKDTEAYAKVSLKKYRPMAARNEDKKVFSGLL